MLESDGERTHVAEVWVPDMEHVPFTTWEMFAGLAEVMVLVSETPKTLDVSLAKTL